MAEPVAEFPMSTTTPSNIHDRDFGHFSDHITVWVDAHIGEENTYEEFKEQIDSNIQVLRSNNHAELQVDDVTMAVADQAMLNKLKEDCYCLKYFSTVEKAFLFIEKTNDKKIFLISSGTIGQHIVPRVAELQQLFGVYIFCGNISAHTGWAEPYTDCIKGTHEHQDNLLEQVTRHLAEYVEEKGDRHRRNQSMVAARNCYSWSKKLLIRGRELGDTSSGKIIETVHQKLQETHSTSVPPT